jgi:isocitrate lyase
LSRCRLAPTLRFNATLVFGQRRSPKRTLSRGTENMTARKLEAQRLQKDWNENPRWKGIKRGYAADDVVRLRGSVQVEHTLAKRGAERLWRSINEEPFVNSLGALTGNQAMQQVKAGLKAIYLSGWQVAGDANLAGEMYPDQSLYPINSVPAVVRRINNALTRCDQIQWMEGKNPGDPGYIDYFAPIVADAEAGFGGVLNAFELMKAMIEAGAAGVHFEDQLASVKKCGHMGGKVLVPTREAVSKLIAARLAADVMGVPTVLLARTDAEAADLVTSDVDENDKPFITGERTVEGFFRTRNGLQQSISRGLAYAPYADLIWCETGKPDLAFARSFAEAIQKQFPGKMLAYNCSPSFNWKKNLDDATIANFQKELGAMGYKFQFITLAGFHSLNYSMFNLAYGYARNQMSAFVELQEAEFAAAEKGFTAVKHQREVGTGYFDAVTTTIESEASTAALKGSTEDEQFFDEQRKKAA